MAVFQGCSVFLTHPKGMRAGAVGASCSSFAPYTPIWTHYGHIGTGLPHRACKCPVRHLQSAAPCTLIINSQLIITGQRGGLCRNNLHTLQASLACPMGLDVCPWGWWQLHCLQESSGKWRGRRTMPSTDALSFSFHVF